MDAIRNLIREFMIVNLFRLGSRMNDADYRDIR